MTRKAQVILAATGHRPDKFDDGYEPKSPIQDWVKQELSSVIRKLKPHHCISGMALGVDQWFAEVCVAMHIPFDAYVPFDGQESKWWGESKIHYYELLKLARTVKTISSPGYEAWKMQKRNWAMVDDCSVLVGVFDGSSGGTKNCIDYATSVKRKTVLIDPGVGEAFITKKEAEARTRGNGVYRYLGSLKWEAIPF